METKILLERMDKSGVEAGDGRALCELISDSALSQLRLGNGHRLYRRRGGRAALGQTALLVTSAALLTGISFGRNPVSTRTRVAPLPDPATLVGGHDASTAWVCAGRGRAATWECGDWGSRPVGGAWSGSNGPRGNLPYGDARGQGTVSLCSPRARGPGRVTRNTEGMAQEVMFKLIVPISFVRHLRGSLGDLPALPLVRNHRDGGARGFAPGAASRWPSPRPSAGRAGGVPAPVKSPHRCLPPQEHSRFDSPSVRAGWGWGHLS